MFSDAISNNPNDASATTRELLRLCGDRKTFEEILSGMSDAESDLAKLLTRMGKAYHKGSDVAPDNITEQDLEAMARQIRMQSGLR